MLIVPPPFPPIFPHGGGPLPTPKESALALAIGVTIATFIISGVLIWDRLASGMWIWND